MKSTRYTDCWSQTPECQFQPFFSALCPSYIQSVAKCHVFYFLNLSSFSLSTHSLPYVQSHHGLWQPQDWTLCLQLDPSTEHCLLLFFKWFVRNLKIWHIHFPIEMLWYFSIALQIKSKLHDLFCKTLGDLNPPLYFFITSLSLSTLFLNSVSNKINSSAP